MKIKVFPTDLLGANCYLVYNQNQAVVVDPAGVGDELTTVLTTLQLELIAIINTHGHVDHIMGNSWIKARTKAPIMIHEADGTYLDDPDLNLSVWVGGTSLTGPSADVLLVDQQMIEIGDKQLQVIHTPGHTPGCICLYHPDMLLSGDTLFKSAVGRTDLPGGNSHQLKNSLQKLKKLPGDTVVYPGHGQQSTIANEIQHNRYLR